MFDFKYFTPTKVLFGKNTEDKVADLIQEFGGKKVLIHYGGGSVIRSGLMQRVTDKLDAAGIAYVKLGGAVPNPRLSLVYEGIELCKKEGVDFLLAVGGGSAIDSAKAIGYGLMNEGDIWQYPDGFELIEAPDFVMDYNYEYADYVYKDGEFVLDPQPRATSTLDDIVAAKVDEAMAQAEQRITAQTLAKANKMSL